MSLHVVAVGVIAARDWGQARGACAPRAYTLHSSALPYPRPSRLMLHDLATSTHNQLTDLTPSPSRRPQPLFGLAVVQRAIHSAGRG